MSKQSGRTIVPNLSSLAALEGAEERPPMPVARYWNDLHDCEGIDPKSVFRIDDACVAAIRTLNPSGEHHVESGHFDGSRLASNPDKHPDASVITAWLVATNRLQDELQVIFWLAYFTRNEWANFPKRTSTEHRALFEQVATLCSELRGAMDKTDTNFLQGDGSGFEGLSTRDLLKEREIDSIVSAADHARDVSGERGRMNDAQRHLFNLFLSLPPVGWPTVQTLLERLEGEARRLESQGPRHTQPNKRGAERGYFVRRMSELFERRYGEQPHEVIAALATIALGEATDRELVAKLLA